jgi:hypothetical protein
MKDGLPSPTPEGQLIRRVRSLAIPKLTIRSAAARVGMSAEQWGYIERGYVPGRGDKPPQPFSPPAATLARMAYALKITPEQLKSAGQRLDAAEILQDIISQQGDSPIAPPEPRPISDGDEAALRPYVEDVLRELYATFGLKFEPGQPVPELSELPAMEKMLAATPGAQVFQAEWEAHLWSSDAATPKERYRTIAILRKMMTEGAEAGVRRSKNA